jgi:hypothetical protein
MGTLLFGITPLPFEHSLPDVAFALAAGSSVASEVGRTSTKFLTRGARRLCAQEAASIRPITNHFSPSSLCVFAALREFFRFFWGYLLTIGATLIAKSYEKGPSNRSARCHWPYAG